MLLTKADSLFTKHSLSGGGANGEKLIFPKTSEQKLLAGPAECRGLAPRRGHAFGARRARWKALAEANILRSTWRARHNALVPFGRGPRPTSVQLVHARTKRTFLGRPWAYPGRPPETAHNRPTTGYCGNFADTRATFSSTGLFAFPRAISGKTQPCYGPRKEEEEEVGVATLFIRTQEPAKNFDHRM